MNYPNSNHRSREKLNNNFQQNFWEEHKTLHKTKIVLSFTYFIWYGLGSTLSTACGRAKLTTYIRIGTKKFCCCIIRISFNVIKTQREGFEIWSSRRVLLYFSIVVLLQLLLMLQKVEDSYLFVCGSNILFFSNNWVENH